MVLVSWWQLLLRSLKCTFANYTISTLYKFGLDKEELHHNYYLLLASIGICM
jgi:hypothetical protein